MAELEDVFAKLGMGPRDARKQDATKAGLSEARPMQGSSRSWRRIRGCFSDPSALSVIGRLSAAPENLLSIVP